jgi:hypothetical protein
MAFPTEQPFIMLAPFIYGKVSEVRTCQAESAFFLNYWTSRLRAALFYWTTHGLPHTSGWWVQGLKNEMVRFGKY